MIFEKIEQIAFSAKYFNAISEDVKGG